MLALHCFNRLNSKTIYIMALKEQFLTTMLVGKPDRVPITVCLFSQEFSQEVLGDYIILYDGRVQAQLKSIRHRWFMDSNYNK